MITECPITQWSQTPSYAMQTSLIDELESGRVLHFNQLAFILENNENQLLTPDIITEKDRKNISYDTHTKIIKGCDNTSVAEMMERFAQSATLLVKNLFPQYKKHLEIGRTSFRPV